MKIGIVGTSFNSSVASQALIKSMEDEGHEIVMINESLPHPEIFTYEYNRAPLLEIPGQKEFICKGKHQYRKEKTDCGDIYWVCQCGRSL